MVLKFQVQAWLVRSGLLDRCLSDSKHPIQVSPSPHTAGLFRQSRLAECGTYWCWGPSSRSGLVSQMLQVMLSHLGPRRASSGHSGRSGRSGWGQNPCLHRMAVAGEQHERRHWSATLFELSCPSTPHMDAGVVLEMPEICCMPRSGRLSPCRSSVYDFRTPSKATTLYKNTKR